MGGEPLFSERLFLEQLAWTEDVADKEAALSLLHRRLTWDGVASFLRSEVERYVKEDGPGLEEADR